MDDVVILEWTFKPPDYFEEPIRLECKEYSLIIENGKVVARIHGPVYDATADMRERLHHDLESRFLGVQLVTHTAYELSQASLQRLHPDGRRSTTLFVDSAMSMQIVGSVDLVVRDKDGNIKSDTRRERIARKGELAMLVERFRRQDPLLASLLAFQAAAIRDPTNEFVHLYDVWEALQNGFGSEGHALATLAITRADRSELGRLANFEPLFEGRHRGKYIGELRHATESERERARGIAGRMIEAYLRYLAALQSP